MDGVTMKVAVCDDNKEELLQLEHLLNEYLTVYPFDEGISICFFENSAKLLAEIERGRHFDLFILDVLMPEINGLELATEIRKTDTMSKIVFLTSSSEFAVGSYSVNAFHYLLKPVEKDKLFPVLEKARRDFFDVSGQSIVVKAKGSLCRIDFRDIVYVEVIGRTLCFQKKDGVLTEISGTLSEIEPLLLADKRFVKPHRSYIVNMDYIRGLSQQGITTLNSLCIPMSRNTLKEVKQSYLDYSFQKEQR